MFCHYWQKFENSKWPPFLGRGKFFENCLRVHFSDTLRDENFDEIALSRMVKEIENKFVFCHFGQKFENSKWPPFLGRGKFLKIAKSTFLRYPVGGKFRRNRPIFTKAIPCKLLNPINTHAKFGKDRINTFHSNERKPSVRTPDARKSKNNIMSTPHLGGHEYQVNIMTSKDHF